MLRHHDGDLDEYEGIVENDVHDENTDEKDEKDDEEDGPPRLGL